MRITIPVRRPRRGPRGRRQGRHADVDPLSRQRRGRLASASAPTASTSPARCRSRPKPAAAVAGKPATRCRRSSWSPAPAARSRRDGLRRPDLRAARQRARRRWLRRPALRQARHRTERRPHRVRHARRLRRRRRRGRQVPPEAQGHRPKRIALVGHSEGAAVALLAAQRDKKIARAGAARRHRHDRRRSSSSSSSSTRSRPEDAGGGSGREDRAAEEDAGRGPDRQGLGGGARRPAQAGRFAVVHEPARLRPGEDRAKLNQPMLVVQGALDTQVPPHHAEQLARAGQRPQEDAGDRGGPAAGRQPPAGAGHDRRRVDEYGSLPTARSRRRSPRRSPPGSRPCR